MGGCIPMVFFIFGEHHKINLSIALCNLVLGIWPAFRLGGE
jgi:hypothetical protein